MVIATGVYLRKKKLIPISQDSLFDYADVTLDVGDMIDRSCFVVGDT